MRRQRDARSDGAFDAEGGGGPLRMHLYAVPAWARLTGSPLSAIEQKVLCREAFDGVVVVLNQDGPLVERVAQLGMDCVVIPVEYRGLRSGGVVHFLRHFWAVAASRFRYVAGVRKMLRRVPGILHVHSRVMCGMYACLAGRLAGVPVVLSLHESPAPGRVHARLDGWWMIHWADRVIAVSAATAAEYRPFLRKKPIQVVHNCMTGLPSDIEFGRTGKPVVMFVGLAPSKRYGDFLAACRLLKERGVEFEGWLVGEWNSPEDRAKAERYVAQHGLGDVIVEKGLVKDMVALYRAISVVAVPSQLEAFPRVIMEGMSHGLPVVATRVNGVPEMVEDTKTGFLIDVGDVQSLAERLERLLRDPALRERMGRAGRRRAEQLFAPERYQREMLAIYREVVSS